MTTDTATPTLEVWELTIPGRVTVTVAGEYGRARDISAMGIGQRLRISPRDRRICQEQIRLAQHDPFRNGMMIKVNREELAREEAERAAATGAQFEPDLPSDNELSDEELAQTFDLSVEDGSFEATVKALSEVNVRRLQGLAVTKDAKGSQITFLNEYVREAFPIGGDTPTYREMQARPDSAR